VIFLFKYATRNRPQWFKETLDKWYAMLSGKHEYRFLIEIDKDDETMNNLEMIKFMASKSGINWNIGESKNKIEAINNSIDTFGFDILVVVSDDMTPVVEGFDDIIASNMKEYFPDLDGALAYKDDIRDDQLITLTIMGRKLYDFFGYIYHPDYKSVWCDNEFTDEVNRMGKVKYIPQTIIKHEWMKYGHDALYERNGVDFFQDKATYLYRKERGFPK
jgi:hypothetical protein